MTEYHVYGNLRDDYPDHHLDLNKDVPQKVGVVKAETMVEAEEKAKSLQLEPIFKSLLLVDPRMLPNLTPPERSLTRVRRPDPEAPRTWVI